jgi:hypothetical protein
VAVHERGFPKEIFNDPSKCLPPFPKGVPGVGGLGFTGGIPGADNCEDGPKKMGLIGFDVIQKITFRKCSKCVIGSLADADNAGAVCQVAGRLDTIGGYHQKEVARIDQHLAAVGHTSANGSAGRCHHLDILTIKAPSNVVDLDEGASGDKRLLDRFVKTADAPVAQGDSVGFLCVCGKNKFLPICFATLTFVSFGNIDRDMTAQPTTQA